MSSTSFGDLFDQAESGEVTSGIPAGTYDVVVSGARPHTSVIFLSLSVLNGPQAGNEVDVTLYIPKPGDKAFASTVFGRKLRGFLSYPDVKVAGRAMDNAPNREAGFDYLATALVGKQVSADLTVRTEGNYAGTNELKSTRPIEGGPVQEATASAPTAQAAQPQPQLFAAQPAEQASAPNGKVPF
jgi:hypothetical protein